jgi:signal transduction histidine kinase
MLQVETGWAEAVEANRLRTVWLNNVVHDLRAPLVIISGSLSMLRDGGIGYLNPQQLEWINKSLETVTHIERLTNDLFDLSQLEIGGLILQRETIALQDFLQNVYDVALGLPWPESVTLDLEVCDPIPDVLLDPLRIRQVLLSPGAAQSAFKCSQIHRRGKCDSARPSSGRKR